MAKKSSALAVRKPSTLAKTVDVEVLSPSGKQLATRQSGQLATRQKGELSTVVNKRGGNTTVVNASGNGETVEERRRRLGNDSSPGTEAARPENLVKGLMKATDAVRLMIGAGMAERDAAALVQPLILNMGNKRQKQPLANGGYIHRRLGGTGFGGAARLGGRKNSKRGGVAATRADSRGDTRRQEVPVGTRQLAGKSVKPLALPGRERPLALPSSSSGFVSTGNELAVVPEKQLATTGGKGGQLALPSKAAPTAKPSKVAEEMAPGTIQNVKAAVERQFASVNEFQAMSDAEQKAAYKLKVADVKAAWKAGKYAMAIDLATSGVQRWHSPAQQRAAESFIEKQLK